MSVYYTHFSFHFLFTQLSNGYTTLVTIHNLSCLLCSSFSSCKESPTVTSLHCLRRLAFLACKTKFPVKIYATLLSCLHFCIHSQLIVNISTKCEPLSHPNHHTFQVQENSLVDLLSSWSSLLLDPVLVSPRSFPSISLPKARCYHNPLSLVLCFCKTLKEVSFLQTFISTFLYFLLFCSAHSVNSHGIIMEVGAGISNNFFNTNLAL